MLTQRRSPTSANVAFAPKPPGDPWQIGYERRPKRGDATRRPRWLAADTAKTPFSALFKQLVVVAHLDNAPHMPKESSKWRTNRDARARSTLKEIETSIEAPHAECLLDLHDIFREKPGSALKEIAEAEMARRGLKAQS